MVADAIPLQRVPTDIRDLLRSCLGALRSQAETFDIALRVDVEANVSGLVCLDRAKIAWVITALVGNALRYVRHGSQTMPGGTIIVHAACDQTPGRIVLEVQDDGPGIRADRLQSLLGESSDSPGLALGLAMARDVVVAHGGTFAIDSDTDARSRGTRVRFTLPAAAAQECPLGGSSST
jgi:signal transduction histidine kinase